MSYGASQDRPIAAVGGRQQGRDPSERGLSGELVTLLNTLHGIHFYGQELSPFEEKNKDRHVIWGFVKIFRRLSLRRVLTQSHRTCRDRPRCHGCAIAIQRKDESVLVCPSCAHLNRPLSNLPTPWPFNTY